jgi:hypothetical protein
LGFWKQSPTRRPARNRMLVMLLRSRMSLLAG